MSQVNRSILDFDCLTFDCCGTLVDWEGGIYQALAPLYTKLPDNHVLHNDRLGVLQAFIKNEDIVAENNPTALYSTILSQTYGRLAEGWGVEVSEDEKTAIGSGVCHWPIYPDTLDALKLLKKHFKLVILSNADDANFTRTVGQQCRGFEFDAVYTAEHIGSYKPDPRNFAYLIAHCKQDLGVEKKEIMHVAQALHHDHVLATAAGLETMWIERGEDVSSAIGGDPEDLGGKVSFSWRFKNLAELAEAVQRAKSGDGK